MPTIKFVNEKLSVQAHEGEDIRSVARKNGVQLYSGPHKVVNCMGFGQCGSCNIIVTSGAQNCSKKSFFEKLGKWLNPVLGLKILSHPDKEVRLACQTKVLGDVEVETRPPINWHGEKFWN